MTERWKIVLGDCRELLRELPADSVDAVVTDPPYELGFMGRDWDQAGISFQRATWEAVLRVLKPGGHLLSFGGTRTYHRIGCAIEDAGFEVRDSIHWVYGTGFPKGQNIEKTSGPAWAGWNTALKPAHEPIVVARKPLSEPTVSENALRWGTGAINVDGCRVAPELSGRWPPNLVLTHSPDCRRVGERKVKPAGGDIAVGSKGSGPRTRTSSIYGDDERERGDWRAYKGDDGLETVADYECAESCPVAALDRQSGTLKNGNEGGASRFFPTFEWDSEIDVPFLYCAKASRRERNEGLADGQRSTHPTVKPVALMRWLVRLVTSPGGFVLDPFCGSGTTGLAATAESFRFVGFESTEEYCEIAAARLQRACPKIERRAMSRP